MRRGAAWFAGTVGVAAVVVLLLAARAGAPAPETAPPDAGSTAGALPTLGARADRPRDVAADSPAPLPHDADPPGAFAEAVERIFEPSAVSLRVHLVDAATGKTTGGSWSTSGARWRAFFQEDRHEAVGRTELASGARTRLLKMDLHELEPEVRLPFGFRTWPEHLPLGEIALGATELTAWIPVVRTATLDLHVQWFEGSPAPLVVTGDVSVAGERLKTAGLGMGFDGRLRLDLPFLPGAEVRVALDAARDVAELRAMQILHAEWTGVVPAALDDPWTADVRVTTAPARPAPDATPADPEDAPPDGGSANGRRRDVAVRVLDVDGAPMAEARVACGRAEGMTDAAGYAVLGAVPVGPRTFRMTAPGRLPAAVDVTIPRVGGLLVEIREPAGATLDVLVVDADGNARPFARVDPGPYLDVAGTAQRLDPFTDAAGARTFARVQPGRSAIRASWLGRTGEETVELLDGQRHTLRIVVR